MTTLGPESAATFLAGIVFFFLGIDLVRRSMVAIAIEWLIRWR